MSASWLHSICEACWNSKNPGRTPYRVREEYRDEKPLTCCFCGKSSENSGIYVRQNPITTPCLGTKGSHNVTE